MEDYFYYTLSKEGFAEYVVKGSKFLSFSGFCESESEFKKRYNEVKKLHLKATHYCYAYRLGNRYESAIYKCADNGEPSGTAGKPILNQIFSKKLTNVYVIVLRYFGGILLGKPGLINAYKNSASMVLQVSHIEKKYILASFKILCSNDETSVLKQLVKKYDGILTKEEYGLFIVIYFDIPFVNTHNFTNEFLTRFSNLKLIRL